ncbi:hypothetical protein AOQ84DRAFT_356668 [Glonium stellatum]|uniref:Uncharacterized protein n=1 Tax=Glonium stellatum TaxID=574774 RepID=A0A8E2ESL8_9PEZI|nr:hypothetical protein AOQ84DRAFT_356668 [Glonium stellatum]
MACNPQSHRETTQIEIDISVGIDTMISLTPSTQPVIPPNTPSTSPASCIKQSDQQKHEWDDRTTPTKRFLDSFTSTDSTKNTSIPLLVYCIILDIFIWISLFAVAFYLTVPEPVISLMPARAFGESLLGYSMAWLTGMFIHQLVRCIRWRKVATKAQKDIETASISSFASSSATLITDTSAETNCGSCVGQWVDATLGVLAAPALVAGLALLNALIYMIVRLIWSSSVY